MKRDELIQEIFSVMDVTQRLMKAQVHREFDQLDLSHSHLQILMIVSHSKSINLKQLADKMRLTPGAITQIVDPLVRKGLVSRTADETDRRVANITMAKAGIQKMAEFKKIREAGFSKLLKTLDKDELETFLHIQQKMVAYLEENTNKTEEKNV